MRERGKCHKYLFFVKFSKAVLNLSHLSFSSLCFSFRFLSNVERETEN